MRLIIAEKPSMGRAIADALPKPIKKQDGYIVASDGTHVSWCIGHILEQVEPDDYDPKYKKWSYQHLPIIPETWQLKPKPKTKSQLTVLRKLSKQATHIVHAGDPDREGQLLVDEVLHYLKLPKTKLQQTERLLVSDLNTSAIKKALTKLQSNKNFVPLSVSALARSRSDWLIGMNLTRAFTLLGQKAKFNSVLSVGRVQTPLLGLVVRRDQEIEEFVSKDYFQVDAHVTIDSQPNDNFDLLARWQPSEHCAAHLDEEGRVINKSLAEHVVRQIYQQPALVKNVKKERKKQPCPLPYNLSSLQIDAAKAFKLSAQQVLDACQSLYERHKVITYPRSDCRYLPKQHHNDASKIIGHLSQFTKPHISNVAQQANPSLKSRAWNDAKVGAHHAIIPTLKSAATLSLNSNELNVYQLIAKQYLAQFFAAYESDNTKIELEINNGLFIAKSTITARLGWKIIYENQDKLTNQTTLPLLEKGQVLFCQKGELLCKQTEPPAHFTDATLLGAMTGIARFVRDPDIKKVLRETDGLGTEATRAGMIELLFKRGYLTRQGKSIRATDVGKALIRALPEEITLPDMTAQWEMQLQEICDQNANYQAFIKSIEHKLTELINRSKDIELVGLPEKPFKPKRSYSKSKGNYSKTKSNYSKSKDSTAKKPRGTKRAPKRAS